MAIAEVGSGTQRATNSGSGVDSATCAFPASVTAGSLLLVAGVVWNSPQATSVGVTDTRGTSYAVFVSTTGVSWSGGGSIAYIAYGIAPSSGACTVTVDPNGTGNYIQIAIDEFSGVHASPLDVDGGETTGGGASMTGSLTTLANNDLLVAVAGDGTVTTWTPGAGYTFFGSASTTSVGPYAAEFKITGAAGPETIHIVSDTPAGWTFYCAAFKEASGATTYTPTTSVPTTSTIAGAVKRLPKLAPVLALTSTVPGTFSKSAVRTIAGQIVGTASIAATGITKVGIARQIAGTITATASIEATVSYHAEPVTYTPTVEVAAQSGVGAALVSLARPPTIVAATTGVAATGVAKVPVARALSGDVAGTSGLVAIIAATGVVQGSVATQSGLEATASFQAGAVTYTPTVVIDGQAGLAAGVAALQTPPATIPATATVAALASKVPVARVLTGELAATSGLAAAVAATGVPGATMPGQGGLGATLVAIAAPTAGVAATVGVLASVTAQTSAGMQGHIPATAGVTAGVVAVTAPVVTVVATSGVQAAPAMVALPPGGVAAQAAVAGRWGAVAAPLAAIAGTSTITADWSAQATPPTTVVGTGGVAATVTFETPGREFGDIAGVVGVIASWAGQVAPPAAVTGTSGVSGRAAGVAAPPTTGVSATAGVAAESTYVEGGAPVTYTWAGQIAAQATVSAVHAGPGAGPIPPPVVPPGAGRGAYVRTPTYPARRPRRRRPRVVVVVGAIRFGTLGVVAAVRFIQAPRVVRVPATFGGHLRLGTAAVAVVDAVLEEDEELLLGGVL